MTRPFRFFVCFLGLGVATTTGSGKDPTTPAVRLLLSEVQPGSLSAAQYCTLVYTDHRFHSEKASRHHGKDTDRKVYEGELSEAQCNALCGILYTQEFHERQVPRTVPPFDVQDYHPCTLIASPAHNFHTTAV